MTDFVLRVSNIPQDLTEKQLRDIFASFGRLSRVFLAKDHVTNLSRGFAFVGFETEADAANAIVTGYKPFKIKWAQRLQERLQDKVMK
jgi:RNA recognition motif-containing protein